MVEPFHSPALLFAPAAPAAGEFTGLAEQLVSLVKTVIGGIQSALENAERQYDRAEKLEAYRRRRQWKSGDKPKLQTLDLNDTAKRLIARLPPSKGRPVVQEHMPLADVIVATVTELNPLWKVESTPSERRQALKKWPRWAHFVEALYRGEHAIAKGERLPGASDHALRLVGAQLCIGPSTVKTLCGTIRKKRGEDPESADFPSMTLAEFRGWMETGTFDWKDNSAPS